MSKIPVEKNGRMKESRGIYSCPVKYTSKTQTDVSKEAQGAVDGAPKPEIEVNNIKKQIIYRNYASLLPKMKAEMEEVAKQNPRILDLRQKLNEISKKQDRNVDKQTKSLINGITQQLVDEKDQDKSGPYSLLFDLQSNPSTSHEDENSKNNVWEKSEKEELQKDTVKKCHKSFDDSLHKMDRLPNVINFDSKPMKEFEYSCEAESHVIIKKTFGTQSRSDLCLHFKSHSNNKLFDQNLSPSDNSLTRPNEENSLDDSLGILTPDQMEDMCYLENAFSPTVEGLPLFYENTDSKASPDTGDTPSTEKTDSHSAPSTIQNEGFEFTEQKLTSSQSGDDALPQINIKTADSAEQSKKLISETSYVQNGSQNVVSNYSLENYQDKRLSDPIPDGFMDEEFMPSIHSSILDPVSSIADTNINLDLPLDCKANNCPTPQRLEQTPSPEDLPLDSSDIHGELSTYSNSQYSTSVLHDSQTFSDAKTDLLKSMETSKVSNSFITSITSITSLDGYQGDGEMSRPVSRTADHSIGARDEVIEMDWQNVPVTRRADPMTDSDFFTESDADGLDDHMQRGDRRAQVIDGALYGGKNANGNPPLIVNRNDDSCMESSGVYTDFENHRSSPIFLNVIDDMSPDGSTLSTHSECSQKNAIIVQQNSFVSPQEDTLTGPYTPNNAIQIDENETHKAVKRSSLSSEKSLKSNDKVKEEKRFTLKKYKMPKRDVPSKLKSMLANRKPDTDASVQSTPKSVKKNDRREGLKKNNDKNDFKTKTSYKDIKSKVDCSFSLQRSQTTCSVTRTLSSKSTNNTKPKSRMRMRMELGSVTGSGKSSLHSSQSDISASSAQTGKVPANRFPLLRNGKKREIVPVAPATPDRTPQTPPHPASTQAKKNGIVQKLSSSPVTVRPRPNLPPPPSPKKTPPRRVPSQRPNTLPTTANNKEPPRVTAAVGPRGKRVQTPQLPARAPAPLVALPAPASKEQTAALAHAAKGVEALGVLVQYLVFRLDAVNGDSWRLEAERWREVAAAERSTAARADRDREDRAKKDLDTIAECLSKISELEMEVSAKEEANARLQATHAEEIATLARNIKDLQETELTLRAQLEAARENQSGDKSTDTFDETDKSCGKCDAACDPVCSDVVECDDRLASEAELSSDAGELAAEVRSLRAVVELKQAEVASLRGARTELALERELRIAAERDARSARHAAEELRERAAARQRDVDRLRDDNRRLRDAAARDRDHAQRLSALNEELRYKLRQKSQVVSLLAGGGYIERGAVRARTASCDSGRSTSPPPSPPSPAASPSPGLASDGSPQLPAVKGVVEKHDSVSWVLEIEETPEEVATRLARRSSFRAATTPTAVKRRGGGSPGSSPAPASPAPNASKLFRPGDLDFPPPPLKESAGEAIYIYDDRQY